MKEKINVFSEEKKEMGWQDVLVGTRDNFVELIKRTDFNISSGAAKLIESGDFTSKLSEKEEKINLVPLSVFDLGFDSVTSLKEIYASAKNKGFKLCPFETGPQLYRQRRGDIQENSIIIATRPILNKIFSIIDDGTRIKCLSTCQGQSHMTFSKNSVFVFRK